MHKYAILVSAKHEKSNGVCSLYITGIKQHMCWGFQDHSFVLEHVYTFLEMCKIPSNLLFVHFLYLL